PLSNHIVKQIRTLSQLLIIAPPERASSGAAAGIARTPSQLIQAVGIANRIGPKHVRVEYGKDDGRERESHRHGRHRSQRERLFTRQASPGVADVLQNITHALFDPRPSPDSADIFRDQRDVPECPARRLFAGLFRFEVEMVLDFALDVPLALAASTETGPDAHVSSPPWRPPGQSQRRAAATSPLRPPTVSVRQGSTGSTSAHAFRRGFPTSRSATPSARAGAGRGRATHAPPAARRPCCA